MSSKIKAIETEYKGYKFRSRLEARWAVFFDAAEIEWEYEPEGFTLSNGDYYLPDFFLAKLGIYVEVKPKGAFLITYHDGCVEFDKKASKYGQFMQEMTDKGYGVWFVFGDPVDALMAEHIGNGDNFLFAKSECHAHFMNYETCICNGETIITKECKNHVFLSSGRVMGISDDEGIIWGNDAIGIAEGKVIIPLTHALLLSKTQYALDKTLDRNIRACVTARQARFEHGEKG